MTSLTIKRWNIPVGVETNGVGSTGNTGHLNFCRSLADVWGVKDPVSPPRLSPPLYRLVNGNGVYLANNGGFTHAKRDAWQGTEYQARKVREGVSTALRSEMVRQ
jgi:hypothetical protein